MYRKFIHQSQPRNTILVVTSTALCGCDWSDWRSSSTQTIYTHVRRQARGCPLHCTDHYTSKWNLFSLWRKHSYIVPQPGDIRALSSHLEQQESIRMCTPRRAETSSVCVCESLWSMCCEERTGNMNPTKGVEVCILYYAQCSPKQRSIAHTPLHACGLECACEYRQIKRVCFKEISHKDDIHLPHRRCVDALQWSKNWTQFW